MARLFAAPLHNAICVRGYVQPRVFPEAAGVLRLVRVKFGQDDAGHRRAYPANVFQEVLPQGGRFDQLAQALELFLLIAQQLKVLCR